MNLFVKIPRKYDLWFYLEVLNDHFVKWCSAIWNRRRKSHVFNKYAVLIQYIMPDSTTHTYTWLRDFWWQLVRPVSQADVNMAGNAKPFKAISSLETSPAVCTLKEFDVEPTAWCLHLNFRILQHQFKRWSELFGNLKLAMFFFLLKRKNHHEQI